jgi:DNA-3-methyladenine glycosylase I
MSYCDAAAHPVHGPYHDHEYGVAVRDDALLLERLTLEIAQAGLSWLTVLNKRAGYRAAFDGFDPERVAAYGDADRERLMADAGIVRNRRKIDATIANARAVLRLREEHGGFAAWLDAHHPRPLAEWRPLFKRTFAFTGGQIVSELLVSTGYLPGAHREDCPAYARVLATNPPWAAVTARS